MPMSPAPTASRTPVVLALGVAQTLAWASSFYLPAMLAAPMARELGVAVPTVYALLSMALVVAALLGPLAGRLIDRLGGRAVLMAWRGLFALGLAVLATAQGPLTLVLPVRDGAGISPLVSAGLTTGAVRVPAVIVIASTAYGLRRTRGHWIG